MTADCVTKLIGLIGLLSKLLGSNRLFSLADTDSVCNTESSNMISEQECIPSIGWRYLGRALTVSGGDVTPKSDPPSEGR